MGGRRARLGLGRGLALIALVAPAASARATQEPGTPPDALGPYRELAPLLRAGSLDESRASELVAAARALVAAGPDAVARAGLEPDELFETAIRAAELAGDAPAELSLLRAHAGTLRGRGEREAVLALLEPRVERLAAAAPADGNLLVLEFLLAQVLREEGRSLDALARIDATLPRALASGHGSGIEGMLHGERASVYLAWGLTDLARRWHERQRAAMGAAPGPVPDNARRHADLVEANLLLAEMGDPTRAEAVERRILEMLSDARLYPAGLQRGRLLVRIALARIEASRGRAGAAGDALGRARDAALEALAIETLEPYERGRGELALCEALLLAGERAQAAAALERALPGDAEPPPDLAAIGAALGARLARESDAPATEAALDAARARLERAALALIDSWARVTPRAGGFSFLHFRDHRRVLGELVALTLATGAPDARERALELVLRAQAASSLARSLGAPAEPPSLAELRAELLPAGHGVLAYLPCPDASFLFALDRDGLLCVELAAMEELAAAGENALRILSRAPPADDAGRAEHERARRDALARAARHLLPPAARAAAERWTHVTLVGAELLEGLDLEELPLGEGRALGERCAVAHASSLPLLLALTRRAALEPEPTGAAWLLACADPPGAAADGLSPLPLDEAAARALLSPYPGETRVILEATPAALRAPELARASVAQLVAHGGRDDEDERPALLRLAAEGANGSDGADDGFLRASDVEAGPAPSLAVLVACEAARAPERAGDAGAADLGGAFLRAGSECVLLSPARVEFHAAWRLLEPFHRELARGAAPSEALRVARAELRADPRFADAWGAARVRLVGLAHRPLFAPPPAPRRAPLLLLAVPLALGLAWVAAAFRRARRARA